MSKIVISFLIGLLLGAWIFSYADSLYRCHQYMPGRLCLRLNPIFNY